VTRPVPGWSTTLTLGLLQARPLLVRDSIYLDRIGPDFGHGSFVGGVGPSRVKTTLRVNPRIARSPSTASSPSRTMLMRSDRKASGGNVSTFQRVSAPQMSARWVSRVSTEAASIEASIWDLSRSDSPQVKAERRRDQELSQHSPRVSSTMRHQRSLWRELRILGESGGNQR
jgi:hypothetical protein